MAVTLTAEDFANRVRGAALSGDPADNTLSEWGRNIYETAKARVERVAPGAPEAIQNEAVIRFGGYLAQAGFGDVVSFTTVGSAEVRPITNHQRAWQRCGAASILAPWKPIRAARIANAAEAE